MKYFTFEWWLSGGDNGVASSKYFDYIESINNDIYPKLLDFIKNHSLHDSNLETIESDFSVGKTVIVLNGWDPDFQTKRQYKLELNDVTCFSFVGKISGDLLEDSSGFGDFGYYEYELLEDANSEIRMLFSSGVEITIRFCQFDFSFQVKK